MQDANSESAPHHDPARDELARDHADQVSTLAELGAMAPLYAHEMNNLMTHLSGRAQLALMHESQSELATQALEAMVEGCHRAAQLAELFRATTINLGDRQRDNQLDLQAIVTRLTHQIPHQSSLPEILVHDQSEGLTISAPDLVVEQVLDNLIRNAVRAIDEHSTSSSIDPQITISLTPLLCSTWNNSDGVGQLELVVEDTGIGMDEHQIAAFLRGTSQSIGDKPNPTHPRHGLGLRVCSLLIKQVGGSIRCESTPNVGTRMIVRLPAHTAFQSTDSDLHKRAA